MTKLKTFGSFNNSDLSGKSSIGFDLFERMSDLSDSFKRDLMLIAEKGIICGSTAHYLHGKLNRLPNDIDVISDSKLLESLSGEILEGSEKPLRQGEKVRLKKDHNVTQIVDLNSDRTPAKWAEEWERIPSEKKAETVSGVDIPHQILYALAVGSDSVEAFLESVAYNIAQTIPGFTSSNFTEAENKRLSSLFDYLKPDTHESVTTFKYLGSKKAGNGTKVCVFEANGDVDHVTMTIFGKDVRVESLSQVEKYRKSFGRISESLGDYEEWEGQVIIALENLLEIDTSDAQGIIMAHDTVMQDCWSKNMSAADTAAAIDKASAVEENIENDKLNSKFERAVMGDKKPTENKNKFKDDSDEDEYAAELNDAADYIINKLTGKKIEQASEIASEYSDYLKLKNIRFADYSEFKDTLSDVISTVKNRLNQDIVDEITPVPNFKQHFGEPTVGKEWRIDYGAPGKGYTKYVVKQVKNNKVYSDIIEDTGGELDIADVI